jgi:hypothetical protein
MSHRRDALQVRNILCAREHVLSNEEKIPPRIISDARRDEQKSARQNWKIESVSACCHLCMRENY